MKLSNKLDEITKAFFEIWRTWRYAQGWRLGPDLPSSLLSPHMVDNWDQLHDEGRNWFRQQAALVLAAVDQVEGENKVPDQKIIPTGVETRRRDLLVSKKKLSPINYG